MNREVQKEYEKRNNVLNVPVAVLMMKGKIFAVREKNPPKYSSREWRFITGRPYRGEEQGEDLVTLGKECGFKIVLQKEIGKINGKETPPFSLLAMGDRVGTFNFYQCEVTGGRFRPQMLLPSRPESIHNQLLDYEGRWFKLEELAQEQSLHPLVKEGLKFLTNDTPRY